MHFVGADIRSNEYLVDKNTNLKDFLHGKKIETPISEPFQIKLIRLAKKYASEIIVSTPDLLKIGFTSKPVEDRCKELSRATGVPVSFKVEYIFRVHGRGEEMEREIHRYLEHKRNSSRREFFDVTLDEAIDAVKKIGEKYI